MTVLSPPRHPTIEAALALASEWCEGHIIDGAPALAHATKVTVKFAQYVPDADPQWLAAALLHDSPFFAPDGIDLDVTLTRRLGGEVARVVRGVQRAHEAINMKLTSQILTDDRPVLLASTSDKIVSLSSILGRALAAEDRRAFWSTRGAFLDLVPYFSAFQAAAAPSLPDRMAAELGKLVSIAEGALTEVRGGTALRQHSLIAPRP
jgi:hypothetical protein